METNLEGSTPEQYSRVMQSTPAPVSCRSYASEFEHVTPRTTARRQLPIVPPIPVLENSAITTILLQQGSLTVHNTPTQKQRLPLTPETEISEGTKQKHNKGTEQIFSEYLPTSMRTYDNI